MRPVIPACLLLTACSGGVNTEAEAEAAYLGLDGMVGKAVNLGFDAYNAASSANIDPVTADGDASGTLTIDGQVDQGSSANKGMRLTVSLAEYSDGVIEVDDRELELTYDTEDGAEPELEVQLRDIPDGTLQGSLVGNFEMTGDLEGQVTLSLDLIGEIEGDGAGGVQRVEGTVAINGSATSSYGIYDVELDY